MENWSSKRPIPPVRQPFQEQNLNCVKRKAEKYVEKLVTDKTGTATSGKIPIATYKNGKVEKNRGIYPGRDQSTKWL